MQDVIDLVSDVLTIVASSIAIFIFFTKKKQISSLLHAIMNWSFQTTLYDLRGKLDRLSEYNVNEPTDVPEIKNILHEIAGHIRGNGNLLQAAPKMPSRLEALAAGRKLTEPNKRSIVAELREVIRGVQFNSQFADVGDSNE